MAGQILITSSFDVEADCQNEDEDESAIESEEEESEEESDIDDDDCNARPCIIDQVVAKAKQTVDWIQCRLCPKWYHNYCAQVDDDDHAYLFKCKFH